MAANPDKSELMRQVIEHLTREFETLERAATEAKGEATHAESKQENKYDTRGLEASYLAAGQSRRAAEVRENLEKLKTIPLESEAREAVSPGSLVDLEGEAGDARYFVLPFVGGLTLRSGGLEVKVVSTASPLGQALLGKSSGDEVRFNGREFSVRAIR